MKTNTGVAIPANAALRRIGAGALAAVLVAAASAASAGTYTVTSRSTGNAADFSLPELFDEGAVKGVGAYDLTVTGIFDSANVISDASRQWLRARDVALQVTLRFGDQVYTLDTKGELSTQVFMDADGTGRLTKRLYQSMSFDPAGVANYARFDQYLFLDADQFPIDSVLAPVSAYYADPIVKGFAIRDSYIDGNGSATSYGEAYGRAGTFAYDVTLAVPEPGTWAMLTAGLALVGFAARRRARP